MDIFGGLLGVLFLAALYPFVGLAIAMESGFPVFFVQSRLGKNGRYYHIIKFRTMIKNAEKDGRAQMAGEKDPRITRVGNFLRVTRLDV